MELKVAQRRLAPHHNFRILEDPEGLQDLMKRRTGTNVKTERVCPM